MRISCPQKSKRANRHVKSSKTSSIVVQREGEGHHSQQNLRASRLGRLSAEYLLMPIWMLQGYAKMGTEIDAHQDTLACMSEGSYGSLHTIVQGGWDGNACR